MKHLFLTIPLLAVLVTTAFGKSPFVFELSILDQEMSDPWLKSTGDLDGDGRTDIIVGGSAGSGLVSYLNRFPNWERSPIDQDRGFSTDGECADIDGDGRNDFVAINMRKGERIAWYQNTESGWKVHTVCDTSIHDIEVADIDGDGLIDLLGRNQKEWPNGDDNGNRLYVLFQQRDAKGTISWKETVLPCRPGEGIVLTDVDGDRDPDIVINGIWFENIGMQLWTKHVFATDSGWDYPNTFIAMGDINGDGRADIILTPSELKGGSYKVSWFECPENPTMLWKEHIINPKVESVLHFVGTGDFDSDGQVDVVTAEMTQGEDPDEVTIYANKGKAVDGLWQDDWSTTTISESGSHSMRILDVDNDGQPDLFGANWRANGQDEFVKLWINRTRP